LRCRSRKLYKRRQAQTITHLARLPAVETHFSPLCGVHTELRGTPVTGATACCLLCVTATHMPLVLCCNSSLKWHQKQLRSLPVPLQVLKQALNVLSACTEQVSDLQELLLCKPSTFRQPQAPLTASAAVAVSSAMSGCILTTALKGSKQSSDQLSPAHAGHSGLPRKPPAQWRPSQAPKAHTSPQSRSLLSLSQEPHQVWACQQPER